MKWQEFEKDFQDRMKLVCEQHPDPAHDFAHVQRVVRAALLLAEQEGADLDVVAPAAYLHDLVWIAKDDPRRSQASRLSAEAALVFLAELGYPEEKRPAIAHAIEAHSFSAGIATESIEAGIVQDADRLDALGAVGIARVFLVGGQLNRSIKQTMDHFDEKLFKLIDLMKTDAGRAEAKRRTDLMRFYLTALKKDMAGSL